MSANLEVQLEDAVWPLERLGEVVSELAWRTGLRDATRANSAGGPPVDVGDDSTALERWMTATGQTMGVDVEYMGALYRDVGHLLRTVAPLIIRHPRGVIAVLGSHKRRLWLLTPDATTLAAPVDAVQRVLVGHLERGRRLELAHALQELPAGKRARAEKAILNEILGHEAGVRFWVLRLPSSSSFSTQLRKAGLPRLAGALLLAHGAQYALFLLSWWIMGDTVLSDRAAPGLLAAWVLLLVSLVPLRTLVTWWFGRLSIGAGILLRRRLLLGALQLDTDFARAQGIGSLLGRTIEADAVERLALGGGLLGVLAVVELAMAAVFIGNGAGGAVHVAALVAWLVVTGLVAARLSKRRHAWTGERLSLTDDVIEQMLGHRTRLAQQTPARWHDGEDLSLRRYFEHSKHVDRTHAQLLALIPRGWLVVGVSTLIPSFIGIDTSTAALAMGIGGVLFAWQSFTRLVSGIDQLLDARVAWERVKPFFHLGGEALCNEACARAPASLCTGDGPIIEAHSLCFTHPSADRPVLREAGLTISPGDRILLTGPSGGGKSTLASLLLGLREPTGGVLLAGGLDLPTLGSVGWRQHVAGAPQFHENHILTTSVSFNLLMGRAWPPSSSDLREAAEIIDELGLTPLLERMPAGFGQIVGETGWQLSHGERSRIYIARALLQNPDLLILDESFAALDPETLELALRCVTSRARALLLIAHP